jgi:hypothetical protein
MGGFGGELAQTISEEFTDPRHSLEETRLK